MSFLQSVHWCGRIAGTSLLRNALRAGAALLIVAVPMSASAADTELGASLENLLAYARQINPEYASMRLEADAANARAAAAGALPDPKVKIELQDITMAGEQRPTLSPSRVGSTRYQIVQELPWFGKRGLQRDIATHDAAGAASRASGTWLELSSRIKSTYAQLYYLSENERLTREILDLMTRLEQVTQTRYAGGLAAQSDAIRAQVEQSSLRNELIALENDKRMAQARLNMLIARPANAPLAAPDRLRPLPAPAALDLAALQERVRLRNPVLSAEESRIKSAEKARDLAYKNRYPDVAVGVAPVQYGGSIREWELMVEFSIPLQQSSRRAQEREAEAMLLAAQSRRDAAANQALSDLAENLSALDAARRTETTIATSLQPQAELTYKAALASYENGKVDFATLLDAQRQIRLARQNRIKAQADAQMRLADIERLVGDEL